MTIAEPSLARLSHPLRVLWFWPILLCPPLLLKLLSTLNPPQYFWVWFASGAILSVDLGMMLFPIVIAMTAATMLGRTSVRNPHGGTPERSAFAARWRRQWTLLLAWPLLFLSLTLVVLLEIVPSPVEWADRMLWNRPYSWHNAIGGIGTLCPMLVLQLPILFLLSRVRRDTLAYWREGRWWVGQHSWRVLLITYAAAPVLIQASRVLIAFQVLPYSHWGYAFVALPMWGCAVGIAGASIACAIAVDQSPVRASSRFVCPHCQYGGLEPEARCTECGRFMPPLVLTRHR